MPIKITDKLKEYLVDQPHVQQIYFTADGSFSAHSYTKDGKAYTRVIDDALAPNAGEKKFFEVVAEFTREQILGVAKSAVEDDSADSKE